ncbi:Rod shape-determining protein MreB [hydrothermal vent metagenome]|uniref:Rod shape-determining protein MreB n=1 Tax=hydrothermal vent metagenome TaxID=652676 RepID=A0A3B1CRM3_9ZZZZ
MFLRKILQCFSADIAMDLGTANTLIYVPGKGIVVNEPSVVAVTNATGEAVAVGAEAKAMYGKTPDTITVIRPMKDGVIADFDATKGMITYFINHATYGRFRFKPRIIIGTPSGITQVEKRAVIDSAMAAGCKEVNLVDEPMAAAIGTKMPVGESCGNLIVDIGGGTTEVAIISMYATSYNESIRVAGDEMDEAIVRHIRHHHSLEIGIFEAERVKLTIGSAHRLEQRIETTISGRDLASSLPRSITITDDDIRPALEEPSRAICESVLKALENTTPEFATEIRHRGAVLAGGGALLKGLGARLNSELKIPIYRAKEPMTAIVRGVGTVLDEWETYKRVCVS